MVVTGGMAAQHNQTYQADHHGCRYDVLVQQRGGKTNTRQHHQVTIIRKTRAPRRDAARSITVRIASTTLAMTTPSAPMVPVTPVSGVHQAYSATAKAIIAVSSSNMLPTRED